MSEDVAKLIFAAIMTIGFVAWAVSLRKALRLGRTARPADPFTPDEDLQPDQNALDSGTIELRGEPQDLSKALSRAMLQLHFGMFASIFQIKQFDDGRILLLKNGPLMCNIALGLYFNEAEIAFHRTGHGTVNVTYFIGFGRLVRLLRKISLWLILGLGLPTLCIMGAIIWIYVIPSPNPDVRRQVMQTLQIVHVLWPPYMFLGFYLMGRRHSKRLIENMISALGVTTDSNDKSLNKQ